MRFRTLSLLPVLTAGLVALPTVSVPMASAAAPAPVAPEVRDLPVDGIDAAVLARSPEPEDEHADEPAGEEHHELAPVAVTQEVATGSFAAVGVTWVPDAALDELGLCCGIKLGLSTRQLKSATAAYPTVGSDLAGML